jgi:hypothetical protein
VTVRVTDSSSPPNLVLGASVTFQTTVMRPVGDSPASTPGETSSGNPAMPVILSVSQSSVLSDVNGLVSIVPSTGAFKGPLEVDVSAAAGANSNLQYVLRTFPGLASGTGSASSSPGRTPPASRRSSIKW